VLQVLSALKHRVSRRHVDSWFVGVLCALGTAYYLFEWESKYSVRNWLVWPLLQVALLTFTFYASFVVAGHALLRRLVRLDGVPTSERLLQSMVLGLGVFALATYAAGALGLLNGWFASLLPAAMFGAGLWDLPALIRETKQRYAAQRPLSLGVKVLSGAATVWGGFMLLLLYLTSLTPNSFNFDAMWYHVPVAQDYARLGRIVPFYGDNHRAYPHLASFFHTWALLVPGIEQLPVRWMLMLQLEVGAVVWRLVGAAAVARYCLKERYVPGLWACFFLYPSVFIYDQNVAGSADHVLGMTAAPLFLAVARMIKRFDVRYSVLGGVAAGCHILTKYQAVYMVAATAGVVALRFVWLLLLALLERRRQKRGKAPPSGAAGVPLRQVWAAPAVLLGVALLLSSPHFIKNTVFYQNPLYPFASRVFPSTFDDWKKPSQKKKLSQLPAPGAHGRSRPVPSVLGAVGWASQDGLLALLQPRPIQLDQHEGTEAPDADSDESPEDDEDSDFSFKARNFSFDPQGDSLLERMVWVHRTLWDWSFRTGNRNLTQYRPYMGSLFTLLLPTLLFLRPARRLWFATLYMYLAFLVWALTNANDRYLLSFLSVPIGISAALLVRAWSLGRFARLGLTGLVASQFVFATEAPFVYAEKRLEDAAGLIRRGYGRGSLQNRFPYHQSSQRLTGEFPPDAVILGRYFKANLGFDRTTLNTHRPIQSYINFSRLENPRDLWQICKDRGVTHLLYPESQRKPVAVQDAVLFDALSDISLDRKKVSGNVIVRLADQPPPNTRPFMVLVRGVRPYQDGLFPVKKLSSDNPSEPASEPKLEWNEDSAQEILDQADALYMRGTLRGEEEALVESEFYRVEKFGSIGVWLRKEPRHGAAADEP